MAYVHKALLIIHWLEKRGLQWVSRRLLNELSAPTFKPLILSYRWLSSLKKWGSNIRFKTGRRGLSEPSSNTLYFVVDLQVCPIAYDIISYLTGAEMARRRLNKSNIYVVILPAMQNSFRQELPEYDAVINQEKRQWRLHHIIIASFQLLPSCSGYQLCSSRGDANLFLQNSTSCVYPTDWCCFVPSRPLRRELFNAVNSGENVFPMISAPSSALRYVDQYLENVTAHRKTVVISLRQYGYNPSRNSNLEAWIDFAEKLDHERYAVIFVQDTEESINPIPPELSPFLVFQPASWNILLRMALYERAHINLAIAQGPMELCWYNEKCRYLMFFPLDSSPLTSREAIIQEGFVIGEDLPFAMPWQKWVWSRDRLEVIEKEFYNFMSIIEEYDAVSRKAIR